MLRIHRYITVLFVLVANILLSYSQESHDDAYFDSLYRAMVKAPLDTTKLCLINRIALEHYNVDTVLKYSQIELDMSRKLKESKYEEYAEAYLYWAYFYMDDYMSALEHAFRGVYLCDSVKDNDGLAKQYHNLGIIYSNKLMDATKGDEYYHKALDLYKQLNQLSFVCDVLRDIGNSNYLYELFDKAEECYLEALAIDSTRNFAQGVAEDYMGLGSTFLAKCEKSSSVDINELNEAKKQFLKAWEIAADIDYEFVQYIVTSELPSVLMMEYTVEGHARKSLLDSCRMIIDQGYEYVSKYGYDGERLVFDYSKIWHLALSRKFSEAQHWADSIKTMVEEDPVRYKDTKYSLYKTLTRMYQAMGEYKKAFECQRLSDYYYRQEHKRDYAVTATQNMAQAKFDEQMRVQKNRELILEKEAEQQRMVTIFTIVILLIVIALATVVVRFWMASRKANEALDMKNCELEEQKEEIMVQNACLEQQNEQIEEQKKNLQGQNEIITRINREMTDSIDYARVIQKAAMPSESLMKGLFGDNLVMLRPLSIVSGDFYWAAQAGHYKMLAVADCTGHGVPGAFLSMLGMSILGYHASNVGNVEGVTAGAMLDEIRNIFKASLHQNMGDDSTSDGMDMAFLLFDLQRNEIHYAGAYRPLIVVHDGEVVQYEADHMPIGVHYKESDHFTDHVVDAQKGDVIYMFSDGMTDQFGYDSSKAVRKFTARRLRSLLSDIHRLPFDAQKIKIEASIDEWRMNSVNSDEQMYEQTDDAVIVGVRVWN